MLTYVFALVIGIWFAKSAKGLGKNAILWFIIGAAIYLAGHFAGGILLRETVFAGGIRTNDSSFEMKLMAFVGLSVVCGFIVSIVVRSIVFKKSASKD
jgi:hypothetical protein